MAARTASGFSASAALSASGARRAWFARSWDGVVAMHRARQTRRMLAEMDGRLLADIGASPSDAHMEANRPFWDFGPQR